jgi:uroporphyrinogen-III synthase
MWILLESRRAAELGRLVERHGGTPLVAPVMREVPVTLTEPLSVFPRELRVGAIDVVVLLTGVGTRALAMAIESVMPKDELATHLSATVVAARGPKTVAALKELGVTGYLVAPEPFTWDVLVDALRARTPLAEKRVVVQEYGVPHPRLVERLQGEGAHVTSLSVYRWELPEDLAPADRAIDALLAGQAHAVLFTSGPQADHLLRIADRRGLRDAVRAALGRAVVGSVGPACSEQLRALGIEPTVEPVHSHMGQLVIAVAERLRAAHDGAA